MRKMKGGYFPGFSLLAVTALTACAGGGGASNAPGTPTTVGNVPNVYSNVTDETLPTGLENLLVFGDSYSNENRSIFRLWHEMTTIGTRQTTTSLESYGVSGASARSVGVYGSRTSNTMKNQVDKWMGTNPTFKAGDATVVWFGYNDVTQLSDLSQSKADHKTQIQRIVDAGALQGDRRIFVPMLHDWERTPGEAKNSVDKRPRVLDWNKHVADVANGNNQIVAVDLFTVFERVHNNPGDFNLANVTTPIDPNRSDRQRYNDTLYDDDFHFGQHGHDIIAEVFNHYMTRGWNWANSLSAGTAASAQLEADIDNGRIDRINKLNGERPLGFSSFAIGSGRDQLTASLQDDRHSDPARSGHAGLQLEQASDSGIALDYSFSDTNALGIVISDYNENAQSSVGMSSTDHDFNSKGVSAYLTGETGGMQWRSLISASSDEHTKRDRNALATANNQASFEGQTMRLAQSVSKPVRLGQAWVTPSANLSYSKQKVDGFSISHALVSDLSYSDAEVSESTMTLGLNAAFDPIAINRDTALSLRAGINYSRSLHRDDYKVKITEAATGLSTNETMKRAGLETMQVSLGADLALGNALSLTSDYLLKKQMGVEADQSLMLNLRYRF